MIPAARALLDALRDDVEPVDAAQDLALFLASWVQGAMRPELPAYSDINLDEDGETLVITVEPQGYTFKVSAKLVSAIYKAQPG